MEYVRAILRESDLSAGRIAAEHHISVRQLYRILADEGISLGDWIRAATRGMPQRPRLNGRN